MDSSMKLLSNINFNYIFQTLFDQLLHFFRKKSYSTGKLDKNIKAHQVYGFDIETNNLIIDYLRENFPISAQIISEESEAILIGRNKPKYTFLIDPVDGSVNVKQGLNIFSVGIALLTGINQLSIKNVIASFVGNFLTAECFIALKGKGAYCNSQQITGSKHVKPNTFIINFELSHSNLKNYPNLLNIIPKIHQVRSLGSAITAMSLVAKGSLDAHIDIRNRLTIENILPSSLIIQESGGIITDDKGNELKPAFNLNQPYSLVVSGNNTIHNWILENLKKT
ncbi:MAG: inositol monophosphatase family protein [Candidatus Helarchaeota archaeon]